jgi:hypothetical protein
MYSEILPLAKVMTAFLVSAWLAVQSRQGRSIFEEKIYACNVKMEIIRR